MPTLTALTIYPLKSGAGLSLDEAALEPLGLQHDRRWMAVRPDGRFLTARDCPTLLLVQALPGPEGLHLRAPGMSPLHVPPPAPDAPRLEVSVWKTPCSAARAGVAADEWLSAYLGQPALLVHVDEQMQRPVKSVHALPGDHVSFADGFPLLLLSEGSLADLNQRLPRAVPMRRFRPNLVVSGCEPFAEDGWKRIRVGSTELVMAKACVRCVVITLDPETARADPDQEPTRTLATYRRVGPKGELVFGQQLIVRRGGLLRIGDPVERLE